MEEFEEPGKSGRVIDVESMIPSMTPTNLLPVESVLLHEEGLQEDKLSQPTDAKCTPTSGAGVLPGDDAVILDTPMYNGSSESEYEIVDLYGIGSANRSHKSMPFVHGVELEGPKGEVVRMRSVFDDGAMVNAIDTDVFNQVKGRLTPLQPSMLGLRMADGRIVPSEGVWSGFISVNGARGYGDFEVFQSGNAWALLFGKPLLEEFHAVHDYDTDEIQFPMGRELEPIRIQNQFRNTSSAYNSPLVGLTIDIKQREELKGDSSASPSRQVPFTISLKNETVATDLLEPTEHDWWEREDFEGNDMWQPVWTLDDCDGTGPNYVGGGQPELPRERDPSTFTRLTDPQQPKRVAAILEDVTIGPDLNPEQREQVQALLTEFADCFALSLGEVLPVKGAEHHLNIPEGSKFRTRVHQRPLSAPQKIFYNGIIDKMLDADIIRPISAADVKCCGATTLAKKAHEGGGLSLEELQLKVNDLCTEAGHEPAFVNLLPLRSQAPDKPRNDHIPEPKQKWRVCQDFPDLNKVTKVAPMPQGDIRMKQHRLSGHRWISTFDFASGFYACPIPVEDQPYICFYVEGRGYFSYKRMPFGLTGAPSTFAGMTANALGDLVGTLFELFVDDGGMAGDIFEVLIADIRTLLIRIRETGLSLSAAKSSFFETEATFAGARVGPSGIKPDLTKLTSIVDWNTPTNLQNLGSFLGLTGYFRSLVKGYAVIAQPLTDLARSLELPRLKGKAAYNRAMKGFSLQGKWTPAHTKAFLRLKIILTSEPVLKGPKYDGTPFVVTTDGCKFGFAGMLSQRDTTVLPNGKEVTRMHPVAFASKRTSVTEEKYKPFILEFAALKFSLDKFSDIIWGFPVELETDCQALRDHLLNDKISSVHARWRDGVLAYQITDVRHRPGKLNPVADGLSRKFVNLPVVNGDGHEWTVSEDWEARTGVVNDIFQVNDVSPVPASLEMLERFSEEKVFRDIVGSLLELDQGRSLRDRKRARHKAKGYMIEGGKLWRIGDRKSIRSRPRVECVTQKEASALAWTIHQTKGHFHRDNIKTELSDTILSPKLDRSIAAAIMDCGKCKNFGSTHIHSLLEPITRRHPFELMVSDTLSMPVGKGGFTKLNLTIDVYAQRLWATKLKAATGKTSTDVYTKISQTFIRPEVLMTDGGPEFDNKELSDACKKRGTKKVVVAAYSPWINGLVEGMNSKLLGILRRLCAPDLGEDELEGVTWEMLPKNWPDYLEEAIEILNNRILPSLQYSPNELLLGLVVNTQETPVQISATEAVTEDDVARQMAYVGQQRFDGYSQIVAHADRRKTIFDQSVMGRSPREVIFKAGQLVQVYRSDLDYTFQTIRKLEPKWSVPRRVMERDRNSYTIATLKGVSISGRFSSRRLRRFVPRKGTALAMQQELIEKELALAEEEADKPGLEEMGKGLLDSDERADEEGDEAAGNGLEDEGVGDDDDVALSDPSEQAGGVLDPGVESLVDEGVASDEGGHM